jgi:hypothetical protein
MVRIGIYFDYLYPRNPAAGSNNHTLEIFAKSVFQYFPPVFGHYYQMIASIVNTMSLFFVIHPSDYTRRQRVFPSTNLTGGIEIGKYKR